MGKSDKSLIGHIKRQIKIVDLAEEHGIPLTKICSGNFTHRCKCPNINHKMGSENTDSLYIDSINNNFYCYGCSANSSSIDFYMICNNTNFSESVSILSDHISSDEEFHKDSRAVDSFWIKINISNLIRNFCIDNKSKYNEFAKLSIRLDSILRDIDHDDYKKLLSLENNIKKYLKEKYK